MKKKAIFNWSGGKDSALALFYILGSNEFEITNLLTSVNSVYNRVSMHGVRRSLLLEQADSIGIPLTTIEVPGEISMDEYDRIMKEKMASFKNNGIDYSIFGDIFLEDLKKYREEKLAEVGMKAVFPLWKKDTTKTVHEIIDLGFKAITVCVDAKLLDESFVGRIIDNDFIKDLPKNIDPCGENGEFHSFVFDGPIFTKPIKFEISEKVLREYKSDVNVNWNTSFWYCDLAETNI